jgi:hypothetical protein
VPILLKGGKAVLYIHVPRTGGSAVTRFFLDNDFRLDYIDTGGPQSLNRYRRSSPQHMHAEQMISVLRPEQFDLILMTVRNPVDRLLSEYRLRCGKLENPPTAMEWFDSTMRRYAEDPCCIDNHIRPQVDFRLPTAEVFHQEDGPEAIVERVEEKLELKLKQRSIAAENQAQAIEISDEDVAKVAMMARVFYLRDFVAFGY